ncbi:MAG: TrbG/VirB9 family P-type conjugative transfer protein [Acidobacteria bacterium]|nr:TrbG/VirB9 family P-type conjugative transfer protein [Acidobacteriota bacterium]
MKPLICRAICLLISVCPLALVHAESAARIVKYSQTEIISIRAKVRFSTLIVLPADEEILDFTTGDKDFWIINGTHNLCYLHPAQAGIRSNMNLVTASGHVYSFLLTEISKEPDSEPDLKVFVAPNDQSSIAGNLNPAKYVRASEVEAYKEEVAELRNQVARDLEKAHEQASKQMDEYKRSYPAKLEFDYSLDKKAQLAPFLVSAVYHDDRFTYIKSAARETPTIYEIKDKKPNLVNFDLEGSVYVISKIVDNGYLVVGKKRVTFNRHSN